MNPDYIPTHTSLERQPSHGYASSESESRRTSGGSGKKRASRAGTRSVTTLSAAQLERKRANDREAQRAIRQRTKDHIETLERTVSELRGSQESSEKIVAVTQQRNRELEEENAYLRTRLSDAGYAVNTPQTSSHRAPGQSLHPAQATSPATQPSIAGASIPRPSSTSTAASLSVAAGSHSSGSRHSSFQHPASFPSAVPNSALPMSSGSALSAPLTLTLTTWRSHDAATNQLPEAYSTQPGTLYPPGPAQRSGWPQSPQQYPFGSAGDQGAVKYEPQNAAQVSPMQQPQSQYAQTPVQTYSAVSPQQGAPEQQTYYPPQVLPQAEFQNMAVSSPQAGYTMQHQGHPQPSYQQSATYQATSPPHAYPNQVQMAPVQMNPGVGEYANPHPPMQATGSHHHGASGDATNVSQALHPPMQYRDDASQRGYLGHYPTG